MGKVVLVSHSRIKEMAEPGEKYSEVWTEIVDGAKEEARKLGIDLTVLSPKSYHDNAEFLHNVKKAAEMQPAVIILPFTPTEKEIVDDFIHTLQDFQGKLIAVNVPPSPPYREALGEKIAGYVGMNEKEAGRMAVIWLLSNTPPGIEEIIIPTHERGHFAFTLRIDGVKEIASQQGVSVREVFVGVTDEEHRKAVEMISAKNGFVTLGVRGTEAVVHNILNAPVVGIDLNDEVRQWIKEGKVIATCIQHPKNQGKLAVEMASEVITKPELLREIYCGPTLVTKNNIEVFKRIIDF